MFLGNPVGSLSRHLSAWERLPASQWAIRVIRSGFRLPWGPRKAPLTPFPPVFGPPRDQTASYALAQEVLSMLAKRATEEVVFRSSPGFYGRIFVVPKSSGGWRPVLDLSPLNKFLRDLRFRMETPSSIRDSMHPGDWGISIDLKDAYFHLLIHPRDRKYLRFVWRNRIFQFRALPFGLAPALWVFTKVARELCLHVRERGIRIKAYLDDWLLLASSRTLCTQQAQQVLSLCRDLGFVLNEEKSDLVPAQQFPFLGMSFDTVRWLVFPTPHRLSRLQELLVQLKASPQASARKLASLLGLMESLAPLVPLGRLHKRQFQCQFRERWSQTSESWDLLISLGPWLHSSVTHWLSQSWLSRGVPITLPPAEEDLFTDASTVGWGAHVGSLTAAGQWPEELRACHINRLELEAVVLALREFLPFLRGKHVLINTDNTTVACYVNKQGGARSHSLSQRAEQLLLWCEGESIRLSAKHVPGKINILADSLSRSHMILPSEWTLVHSALEPVWEVWFKPQVDLFATRFNHRLPLYVSPVPDPTAWAIDALSIPWSNLLGYAFPPFPILGKVLRKAREDLATLILVAPRWPAQAWFPELLHLSHVPPVKLSVSARSLLQPRSGIPHGNPDVLNLHAWLLCGTRCLH
ncbi:hypothetical protein ACOMHN_056313 [Nucella lapillus]